MKNLIIFVLALIALSSVCSVKLNKVLKEEKVLSVAPLEEKVESENDNKNNRPGPGRKIESENKTAQRQCLDSDYLDLFNDSNTPLSCFVTDCQAFRSIFKSVTISCRQGVVNGIRNDCPNTLRCL